MGVGGGGAAPNDGYPGALYDFQKEVLFPRIFEDQEAAQLEQLRGLQNQLSDRATGGIFSDIEQLTAQAQSQQAVTSQLERQIRDFNADERLQFARANLGDDFVQEAQATPSGLTIDRILDRLKQPRNEAVDRFGRAVGLGRNLLTGGISPASRGVPASSVGFPTQGATGNRGREPRVNASPRLTAGRPEQRAYLSQFGGRVPKGGFFDRQARRRAAQGKVPIGAGSGLSYRQSQLDSAGGRRGGLLDLQGLIGSYLDEQRAFAQSQRDFQERQLGLQAQSLFQERQAFSEALAQQQSQFEAEQTQRQEAYDLAITEQRAAQEAAAEQQQKIQQLAQAGKVRSQLAERQLSRAQQRLGGLRAIQSNVRQKRSASVSPTLGSRDLALGLFGQRKPR